ncbi:hypothetical protein U9M48_011678 [Paspalum notatum var. saurae]|uniref:Uncharacterized protein n=1 Tax=Paspalum notatum var. saurae TaxID=547442 RepID=A0AAQ3SXY8_PASNO
MALRSLVFKTKAAVPLPRGVVPRSATFFTGPKDDPWGRINAEYKKASRNGTMEEFYKGFDALLEKEFKPLQDKLSRDNRILQVLQLLTWVGGFCSIGYLKRC